MTRSLNRIPRTTNSQNMSPSSTNPELTPDRVNKDKKSGKSQGNIL